MPRRSAKLPARNCSAFALSLPGTTMNTRRSAAASLHWNPTGPASPAIARKDPALRRCARACWGGRMCASRARFPPALPQISRCCSLLTPTPAFAHMSLLFGEL